MICFLRENTQFPNACTQLKKYRKVPDSLRQWARERPDILPDIIMEKGFQQGQSDNLPKLNSFLLRIDYIVAEMRGIKLKNKFTKDLRGPPGDLILKTQFNSLESYGLPLPVLVTETLTFASSHVSVKLSTIGWCWLVCGRKLLVWQYRESKTPSVRGAAAYTCRELTLPQTDLAHKAGLVCVFFTEGNQMPSCIGVSPEGVVRYWPSVAHEGTYVDESAELQGQECDGLTDVMPVGCVLATTTCTVVLVQANDVDGRHTVSTRTLRGPSGWLGGLGRRVSLLFFGSMPAQMVETKLVGVTILEMLTLPNEEGELATGGPYAACVAAGPCLQLWRLPDPAAAGGGGGGERLLHEAELRRPLQEAYCQAQMFPQSDIGSLDVFVLDMQASNNGLLLLTAAVAPTRSPDMRYALVQISVEENPRSRITAFVRTCIRIQRTAKYRDEPDSEALGVRFLNAGNRAFLYTQRQLMIVSSTIPDDKPDYIDLNSEGDRILGGQLCFGLPLFFTKNNGVISVMPNDYSPNNTSICDSPIGSPCPSEMYDGHLSLYEIDPHEVSMVTTDACGKLKTAFLYHLRRDAVACRNIIDELFPLRQRPAEPPLRRTSNSSCDEPPEERDVDAVLDRTVVNIAKEMLDDVPAGDPRWNQSSSNQSGTNIPLGSSAALQIPTQLRDKQRALNLFIDFLRATGLWHRLGYISRELAYIPASAGCGVVGSRLLIAQLLERLAAATALRRLQEGAHAHVLDTAIHQVINSSDSSEPYELEQALSNGTLSPSDLFYKRVTGVERVFHALANWCEDQAASDAQPQSVAKLLLNVNQVILGVLQEIHKCRNQNATNLEVDPQSANNMSDAVVWTGAIGSKSLLTVLARHQKLTIVHGARTSTDATLRGQLYDQAVSLAEHLLTDAGYLTRNQATQHTYEKLRHDLIQPFIEDMQYDRAGILAEKFKDFDMLILICSKADDLDKLYGYMDKYANEGVIELTFARLVESGNAGSSRVIRSLGARYAGRLRAWLGASPDRHQLLWLHELQAGNWQHAAAVMSGLAAEETASLGRMTTMASLAKLCLIVDKEDSPVRRQVGLDVERCLKLGEQHAYLPREILLQHGMDSGDPNMRVYTPAELIDMYITADKRSLTEAEFRNALCLTDFIDDDEERAIQRQKVWCAAILRDDWSQYSPDSPLDAVQEKVFFKLVDQVHLAGADLLESLPSVEEILSAPELSRISRDTGFQFILKYGYEYVGRTQEGDVSAGSS